MRIYSDISSSPEAGSLGGVSENSSSEVFSSEEVVGMTATSEKIMVASVGMTGPGKKIPDKDDCCEAASAIDSVVQFVESFSDRACKNIFGIGSGRLNMIKKLVKTSLHKSTKTEVIWLSTVREMFISDSAGESWLLFSMCRFWLW